MPDAQKPIRALFEAFQARRDLRLQVRELGELLLTADVAATNHVLGFAHIKLADFDGSALRLHLWPNPPLPLGDPPWQIHTHGWTVDSFVVTGTILNRTFSVLPANEGRHRIYRIVYGDQATQRVATERVVDVREGREFDVREGQYYGVATGEFHSSEVRSDFAATIVLSGRRSPDCEALVVGDASGAATYEYRPRPISRDQVGRLLQRMLDALEDRG